MIFFFSRSKVKKTFMRIRRLDLNGENLSDSVLLFTTNGNVKKNGNAVMGRGLAKWVKENLEFYHLGRWIAPDKALGIRLRDKGNIPHLFVARKRKNPEEKFLALSIPTKHNWWEKSDIELIRQSVNLAIPLILKSEVEKVYIPLFGTGNGRFSLEEVKPILNFLEAVLRERGKEVIIFTRKTGSLIHL